MLLGIVILGLLAGGVRCSGTQNGRADAQLASLQANAHKASLAGIRSRRVTDSVIRKVDSVTREMTNRIAANRKVESRLSATLAENDSILSLPPDSVGEGVLRDQLAKTSEVARVFRDSTQVLLSTVLFSISAHEAERSAWLAERESNTTLLAAKDNLISALQARECRVLWRIPCPTRKQSVVAGFVVGVLTLAVAR
jgi:hypothetical protein